MIPRGAALALLLLAGAARAQTSGLSTELADFTLTERSGKTVTLADLKGKVWVASFIMTYCKDGKCPQVTKAMQKLQQDLAGRKDVVLVTFSVDPDRDGPERLREYADAFEADPERWLFLADTKGGQQIDAVLKSVLLPARSLGADNDTPLHAQKLIVVDRDGNLAGFYDGIDSPTLPEGYYEKTQRALRKRVDELLQPKLPEWMPKDFPLFNAALNGLAGVLLLLGYSAVRSRAVGLHKVCMLAAIAVSTLFLTSYLFYHLYVKQGQPTRFAQQWPDAPAWAGWLYYSILTSHTFLAVPTAPMALYVAYQGLRGRIAQHTRLARWLLPVWVYVSITGVVVYWMLYRLYPAA